MGIITSILGGGLTGLLGTALTTIFGWLQQREKNKHEIALIQAESEAMVKETEAQIKITKTQVEGAVELADAEAYKLSQLAGQQSTFKEEYMKKLFETQGWLKYITVPLGALLSFLLGLVDLVKALMRPGLTLYMFILSTWLSLEAYDIINTTDKILTSTQAYAIFAQVTDMIIYLTISFGTWWFGDRRTAKFLMRLNDGNIKKR